MLNTVFKCSVFNMTTLHFNDGANRFRNCPIAQSMWSIIFHFLCATLLNTPFTRWSWLDELALRAPDERSSCARRAASWMFAILQHLNDQIASSSSQLYERSSCARRANSSSQLVEPASSCKRSIRRPRCTTLNRRTTWLYNNCQAALV